MPLPSIASQTPKTASHDVTISMYEKGRSFIMAGGLVKAYEGHKFVYLHLLCQGLECIGKALLLKHDYQKYAPMLRKSFGHDLAALVSEIHTTSRTTLVCDDALQELTQLNHFYKTHILRYGNASDLIKESSQLSANFLHRDLVACLDTLNEQFSPHE